MPLPPPSLSLKPMMLLYIYLRTQNPTEDLSVAQIPMVAARRAAKAIGTNDKTRYVGPGVALIWTRDLFSSARLREYIFQERKGASRDITLLL